MTDVTEKMLNEAKNFFNDNKGTATIRQEDSTTTSVRNTVEAAAPQLVGEIMKIRNGSNRKKPQDVLFTEVLKKYFDCTKEQYLALYGVNERRDTLASLIESLGLNSIDPAGIVSLMKNGSPSNTGDLDAATQFLLRQYLLEPVMVAFNTQGRHLNWVSRVEKSKTGKILRAKVSKDLEMKPVQEAEDISLGTLSYSGESFNAQKFGRGIAFSDEMLQEFTLSEIYNNIFEDFAAEIMTAMDYACMQAFMSNVAVAGVDTVNKMTTTDISRIVARMDSLNQRPTNVIGYEHEVSANLNVPEHPIHFDEYAEIKKKLTTESFLIPQGKALFFNKMKAMIRVDVGTLTVESARNARNQTSEVYVSQRTKFIKGIDTSVVLLDKSQSFATTGFPSYMDIDGLISKIYG